MNFLLSKFTYWFSLLLLFTIPAFTQVTIIGRVVDERDNAPLPDASVYFNATTIGRYTNQQGDFHFNDIRLPGTELVIFCPGYKLLAYKPSAKQVEGRRIVFKLQKESQSEGNKIPVTEASRKALLSIFRENFLGITEEAIKSIITNEHSIYFGQGNSKTGFSAYADTPLVIINNMLGYKISYNLAEFMYDDSSGQSYFFGYARYEELSESKKWVKNRQHCYLGSTMHFYRSLITHQLYEQGFGTFILQPAKDTIVKGFQAGSGGIPVINRLEPVAITEQEILYIDSTNNFSIRLNDRLLVQYNTDPYSKRFLSTLDIFLVGILGKGVESYLLFNETPVEINNAGVLSDPTNVSCSGYWMYERLANTLPFDYQPG